MREASGGRQPSVRTSFHPGSHGGLTPAARWVYTERMILHVDMDAFYAAVEQRDRPELRGRPVVVGGSETGRGVVCAASYEARRFGVHSAMPAAWVRRTCPDAVFVRSRFKAYAAVSRELRAIFHRFTPLVQPLSLDEAFLDVTGSERLFGDAAAIGAAIQDAVRDELGLPCSVGASAVKFVAKVASDLEKPHGFVVVPAGGEVVFLDPLPVARLWGVGAKAEAKLRVLGVRTVGDVRRLPADVLRGRFGRHGAHLHRLAHAVDPRVVSPDRRAKQVSHESTFGTDVTDPRVARAKVSHLADQVARRLRRSGRTGRTVTLKVRYDDFHTITRSRALPAPTAGTRAIWRAADELLRTRLPARRFSIRLLGVGVGSLNGPGGAVQRDLFADAGPARDGRLDAAADALRARFGDGVLTRGLELS